jgi:S1-C subfamily serine protease
LLLVIGYTATRPPVRAITQQDIDAAVLHTLDGNVLPSPAAKAFDIVQQSVVRVRRLEHLADEEEDRIRGVGSGVVIVDKGVILTNLHVVNGAEHIQVVFADGYRIGRDGDRACSRRTTSRAAGRKRFPD